MEFVGGDPVPGQRLLPARAGKQAVSYYPQLNSTKAAPIRPQEQEEHHSQSLARRPDLGPRDPGGNGVPSLSSSTMTTSIATSNITTKANNLGSTPPGASSSVGRATSAYNGALASKTFMSRGGSGAAAQGPPRNGTTMDPEGRALRARSKEIHADIMAQTSVEGILRLVQSSIGSGSELPSQRDAWALGPVATALHRSAKMAARSGGSKALASDPRFKLLVDLSVAKASVLMPMSLALAAWAMATVKYQDIGCFQGFAEACRERAEAFKPQDLSGVSWAFAVLEKPDLPLFNAMATQSLRQMEQFLPQDLSMVAWAFARIALQDSDLFDSIATEAIRKQKDFAGQNLANTLWAFGHVSHSHEGAFGALAGMCTRNIDSLSPVELSTTLWACAAVNYSTGISTQLFADSVERVGWMASKFEVQQLVSIAWSFARVAFRSQRLFGVVSDEVVSRQLPLEPTEINRLVWAFAYPGKPTEERTGRAGGIRKPDLLAHIANQAKQKMQRLDTMQVSSISWAFATLGYCESEFFHALGDSIVETGKLHFLETQNIAYLLWSFARLAVQHDTLLRGACEESCSRGLASFDPRHLSMLLWAVAKMENTTKSQRFWVAAADAVPKTFAEHLDDPQGVASLAMTVNALQRSGQREVTLHLLDSVLAKEVDISGDAYSGWLSGSQVAGDVETELRLWNHISKTAPNQGLRVAASNKAILRAFDLKTFDKALALLAKQVREGLVNTLTPVLMEKVSFMDLQGHPGLDDLRAKIQCLGWKPRSRSDGLKQARAAGRVLCKWDYYKEIGVLEYVFARALPGDPASVCAAIEAFSREENLYLKLGAEEKGLALDAMLRSVAATFAGPPLIVEIGCYVGYSSVRMSSKLPAGSRLVTIEVDPYHAAISRSILELSGMSHVVEIWIGHSEHMIPRLGDRFGPNCVNAIFFDQKGTRYHHDLDMLEENLLAEGAFVCADNVVRPGAPEFMWRVCEPTGKYETQSIAHRDYGQDSVEDWVSLSRYCPKSASSETPSPCPKTLEQLSYESDQIRNRSINERVTEEEWRIFATRVREEFYAAGIRPPVLFPKGHGAGLSDLYVELQPWRRHPPLVVPSND